MYTHNQCFEQRYKNIIYFHWLFILDGWGQSFLSVAWPSGVQLVFFFCSGFQLVIRRTGISIVGQLTESVESSYLIHQGGYHDLFVCP